MQPVYISPDDKQNNKDSNILVASSSLSLIVRRTHLLTVGDQAFLVAVICILNGLPQHVSSAHSANPPSTSKDLPLVVISMIL